MTPNTDIPAKGEPMHCAVNAATSNGTPPALHDVRRLSRRCDKI